MSIKKESLEALENLTNRMSEDPVAKQAYGSAVADLQEYLARHQYFGEAAVMVAALTLAQDEEPTPPTDEDSR